MTYDAAPRCTVIVVDDQPSIRALLVMNLSIDPRFGEVWEAGDADRGVELAREHQPDVVVLDNHMPPRRSGLDALPELRAAAPDARIFLFSGDDEPSLQGRAEEAGAVFIAKDRSVDELLDQAAGVFAAR